MKNTSDNSNQNWLTIYDGIKDKLHGPWLTIYLIPLVAFLCSPFLGDLLMRNINAKLIGFGIGLTLFIWAIILIIIQNNSSDDVPGNSRKKTDLSVDSTANHDSSEPLGFLVFPNKRQFDIWHKEVMFRLGLPKHGRRYTTNEVTDEYVIKQYANWKPHLDPLDRRVRCGYDNKLPSDLIDNNAQLKYKFIKASYDQLEEMGFIKDRPNIVNEEIFNFDVFDTTQSISYVKPIPDRSWTISPEFNFEFIMCLYKITGFRNKYIADLGSIPNKNRISIYLDKEDHICFRVIDENSTSHIIRINHKLFNTKYQLNFKFARSPAKSYLEFYLNGRPLAVHIFNFRVPFHYDNNSKIFVGANLDGTYCCKMMMFIGRIFAIKENNNVPLFTFDPVDSNSTIVSDQEIIAREVNGVVMEEKHSN